jgi:hypothetical protein
VILQPRKNGLGASGSIKPDGTFEKVLAYPDGWGAAPGKYTMAVLPAEGKGAVKPPEKYQHVMTSELYFEIKAGDNDLGTITLK